MAKIGFHINKSKKDKNGFVPIRAKISAESLARYKAIDKVKERYWNKKKQRVSPNRETEPYNRHKEINQLLDEFEAKANVFFNYCTLNSVPITLESIEGFFAGKMASKRISKITFNEAFDEYIESQKPNWKFNTIRNYTTAKNYFLEFQEKAGYKITWENIDLKLWDEFVKYSYETRGEVLEDGSDDKYKKVLEPNTLAKYRNVLVSFLNWATEREYYSGIKHLKFKAPERNIDIIYLTEDELDLLYFHKFENKTYDRIRDIFCFGCYTGLRYSDLSTLTSDHIQNGMIRKTMIKNSAKTIEVPILPMAQEILDKYNYSFSALPIYTDQPFNRFIKKCCEEAKINKPFTITRKPGNKPVEVTKPKWEFIVVHTARKTFINLAHKYDMPQSLIMDIVGHSEYETFMKYRKYEPEKKKEDMNKAFKGYIERISEKKQLV